MCRRARRRISTYLILRPPVQVNYGHHKYAHGHTYAATYGHGHPHGQLHHRRHYSAYPSNAEEGRESTGGEDEGSSDSGTNRDRANSATSSGGDEGVDRVNVAVGSLLTLLASVDDGTESDESNSRQGKRSRTEEPLGGALGGTTSLPHHSEFMHGFVPQWAGQQPGMFAVSWRVARIENSIWLHTRLLVRSKHEGSRRYVVSLPVRASVDPCFYCASFSRRLLTAPLLQRE